LSLGIQNKNRLNNDYCQLWEASEDWGGFQTARIIAQPFLHTKKFLSLPEKFLRLAPKISGADASAVHCGVICRACAIKFQSFAE